MIKGLITGAFDVIHPGYIKMFKYAKTKCDFLTILLHNNPLLERDYKLKPILSTLERTEILMAIRYIDDVIVYNTEIELYSILSHNIDSIRFLGNEYKNVEYTGKNLSLNIEWVNRSHNWSTTKYKQLIYTSFKT